MRASDTGLKTCRRRGVAERTTESPTFRREYIENGVVPLLAERAWQRYAPVDTALV
jgi:hypothetical protein